MQEVTIEKALEGWSQQDLGNLWALLADDEDEPTIPKIKDRLKWLYHSRTRAAAESAIRNLWNRLATKVSHTTPSQITGEHIREMPRYDRLLTQAAKHVKAYEGKPTLEECETCLSHAVIIAALQRMSPSQRMKFFAVSISMDEIVKSAGVKSANLKGPITTFAALGAAQASGFGVYLASTTALGFLTHAIGITLPFAVYTGLTSTIAFVIGPVGWLSAGIWGAWKLTQPRWKHIIRALLYIASTNSRRRLV